MSFNKKIIFVTIAFLVPLKALAIPNINMSYEHNSFRADNLDSIKKHLAIMPHEGMTLWKVSWNYSYKPGAIKCSINNVSTKVYIQISMPEWIDKDKADSETQNIWKKYYDALYKHEQGHAQNAIDAANEIEQTLAKMAVKCDILKASVNRMAHDVIRKYNKKDIDYDNDTDHGRKSGVEL